MIRGPPSSTLFPSPPLFRSMRRRFTRKFMEKISPSPSRICPPANTSRSEEHTSELQSPWNLVCRRLVEEDDAGRQMDFGLGRTDDIGGDVVSLETPRHGPDDAVFFYCYGDHRDLHSFPTRRSSDLGRRGAAFAIPTDCEAGTDAGGEAVPASQ